MALDNRLHPRVLYTSNVLINERFLEKGGDISENGLFIHSGRELAKGSIVEVKFPVKGRELFAKAMVTSSVASVGIGLSFVAISESDRSLIREYVESKWVDEAIKRRAGKTVLLANGNSAKRILVKNALVHRGLNVMEASDGAEAVARLNEATTLPSIILLDLNLEKMDGFSVLAYIKGNQALKEIPVVVISAHGGQADKDKAMSLGADGFLAAMTTSPAKLSEYIIKVLKRLPDHSPAANFF